MTGSIICSSTTQEQKPKNFYISSDDRILLEHVKPQILQATVTKIHNSTSIQQEMLWFLHKEIHSQEQATRHLHLIVTHHQGLMNISAQ